VSNPLDWCSLVEAYAGNSKEHAAAVSVAQRGIDSQREPRLIEDYWEAVHNRARELMART
jgi:hypothetical protein